jgi:hypothetical protein
MSTVTHVQWPRWHGDQRDSRLMHNRRVSNGDGRGLHECRRMNTRIMWRPVSKYSHHMRRLTYSCMRLTPYVYACMQRYANVPPCPDGRQRRRMCDRIRSMRRARYGCGYEVDTRRSDGSTTCSICSLNTRLVALAIQSVAFGARQWGHARRDSKQPLRIFGTADSPKSAKSEYAQISPASKQSNSGTINML